MKTLAADWNGVLLFSPMFRPTRLTTLVVVIT
jgi:hypothetical protein